MHVSLDLTGSIGRYGRFKGSNAEIGTTLFQNVKKKKNYICFSFGFPVTCVLSKADGLGLSFS